MTALRVQTQWHMGQLWSDSWQNTSHPLQNKFLHPGHINLVSCRIWYIRVKLALMVEVRSGSLSHRLPTWEISFKQALQWHNLRHDDPSSSDGLLLSVGASISTKAYWYIYASIREYVFLGEIKTRACLYLERGTDDGTIEPWRKTAKLLAHVINNLNLNFLALKQNMRWEYTLKHG